MEKSLTLEEIQKADDLTREPVPVPEWGGTVYVRMLTAEERDEIDKQVYEPEDLNKKEQSRLLRIVMVVNCLCDENGQRLLKDDQAELILKKNKKVFDRLFNKAVDLNALSMAKLEELEKKSEAVQADGSPSD